MASKDSQERAAGPRSETHLDHHAIDVVKALAVAGSDPAVVVIDKGLGTGLPSEVLIGFNRDTQTFVSLKPLIEEQRLAPARRKGTAKAETLNSFVALIERHKDEHSAIFGKISWPDPKLTAVLNYDREGSEARFGDHRIEYAFPLTEEFKAWVKSNGQIMKQEEAAAKTDLPAFEGAPEK